jgi:murein DD-endopeptidase MepM/ murein hydrolase activator NlpD
MSRLLSAVALSALVACGGGNSGAGGADTAGNPLAPIGPGADTGNSGGTGTGTQPMFALLPTGLAMPVRVDDINLRGVINPFGVVRSSLDSGSVGHPGIDIPLTTGSPLFAVADGTIVSVIPTNDALPGSSVKVLLAADQAAGSGWIFLYEHLILSPGVGVDSVVTRGEQIGTTQVALGFTNHLELSHAFNGFEFLENQTCWVDQLDGASQTDFLNRFNTTLRTDSRFIAAWQTVTFEGRLPFRGLLDTTKYPGGASLCYPTGTDERADP